MPRVRRWALVLATACSNGVTDLRPATCTSAITPQGLGVGQFVALDPAVTAGCVVFPQNSSATDSAEYLLVPQATTETPDLSASFRLVTSVPSAAPPLAAATYASTPPSPAQRFHNLLREFERTRVHPGAPGVGAQRLVPPAAVAFTPVVPGERRRFKVINSLTNVFSLDTVTAFAQTVGQHIAIFVDSAAPSAGLSSFDLDTLRDIFDSKLYVADTTAFGRESDVDANGVVIVLLTNVVNKLVTAAHCTSTGYVAGFFFGGDIDPYYGPRNFNNAEIFYAIVPDSNATLSCPHRTSLVKRLIPPTFVHEFQHMISYNQHVLLRNGSTEVLWLNEAMSHYAEERGGRAFLPGDSASYCGYVQGDLSNAGQYLAAPGSYPLVDTAGIGGLAQRGAGWLFVRYLVDQFAGDTSLSAGDAFTRTLDQTNAVGTANVAQHTGASFATTVERWALANWVSDLPGFSAPAPLTYKRWTFRSAYPALHAYCNYPPSVPASFPLVAVVGAQTDIDVSSTMHSGSGALYQRLLQGPKGAGGYLLFSDGAGTQLSASVAARLNVIRIR